MDNLQNFKNIMSSNNYKLLHYIEDDKNFGNKYYLFSKNNFSFAYTKDRGEESIRIGRGEESDNLFLIEDVFQILEVKYDNIFTALEQNFHLVISMFAWRNYAITKIKLNRIGKNRAKNFFIDLSHQK